MSSQTSPVETCSSPWNSAPIGKSFDLCLCQDEHFSPQLILEYKVFRSVIDLQNNPTSRSQVQYIGTLISDDESQRLTYIIDHLLSTDGIKNHHPLTGEFFIPIQYDNKSPSIRNSLIQTGIKEIDAYCHSSLPIELHRFSYLCSQISFRHSSSVTVDLSFNLITIKNSFILTPINSDYVRIIPTALLKNLNSSSGNNSYTNRSQFGYCSLDQTSKKKILFLHEDDPQACVLPLVGIWISGINDVQCAFVWSVCIRYSMNSSLKQRVRPGRNPKQSFLLACYLSSSCNQWIFYEVNLIPSNSALPLTIDYDVWTCSKQIMLPNLSLHQYDLQFPYDFDFKRIHNEQKKYALLGIQFPENNRFPMDDALFLSAEIHPDDNQEAILSSSNTNGSLFGVPRLPPKQSMHQSPSWDSLSTTTMTTPKRIVQSSTVSPRPTHVWSTLTTDTRWREELIERMQSYETHIQSLTALVAQLLDTQKQQNSISTPIKQCTNRDVAIQTESTSPKIEQQTSFIHSTDKSPFTQFQSPSVAYQHEPMVDDSSRHKSATSLLTSTDLNPIDILEPVFRFIDNQQQGSPTSLMTASNSNENMSHSPNAIQQHMTSTRTTGISFISNGVQMQIINQESSTTAVYPQSQPALLPPTSPKKSENNLSVEVHSLEMKYLEDDQLAVGIECDRQTQASLNAIPQTSQSVDKSLSFRTEEYLQRYGLFTGSNHE